MKKLLPAAILLPFAIYSTFVIVENGYFGFLTLSLREPWAMQMLLDLSISLLLVGSWIRRDAKEKGIVAMPYLLLLPFLGSLSALAYLVHRGLKSGSSTSRGHHATAPMKTA